MEGRGERGEVKDKMNYLYQHRTAILGTALWPHCVQVLIALSANLLLCHEKRKGGRREGGKEKGRQKGKKKKGDKGREEVEENGILFRSARHKKEAHPKESCS